MSIDVATLLLQVINVLVLLWLLQRFFLRPLVDVAARRKQLVTQKLEEARQLREATEALKSTLEAEKAGLADAREKVLAEARVAARTEREAILAKADVEAASRIQAVQLRIAEAQQSMRSGVESQARTLAIRIARRLLDRLPKEPLNLIFLEDSCHVLAALPPDLRQIILEDMRESAVTVATVDGSSALQEQISKRLGQELGPTAKIEFREDAGILAGIEIRFRRLVVRNSWSSDLERLQLALDGDGNARNPN